MRKAPFRIILAPHAMYVAFGQFRLRVPMLLRPVDNPSQPYYMCFVTLSYTVCCFLSFHARRLYAVHRHCRSAMGLIPHPAVIISAVRTLLASCRCVAVYFSPENFSAVADFISYHGG